MRTQLRHRDQTYFAETTSGVFTSVSNSFGIYGLIFKPKDSVNKFYLQLTPINSADSAEDVTSLNSDSGLSLIKSNLNFISDLLTDQGHLNFFKDLLKINLKPKEGFIRIPVTRLKNIILLSELKNYLMPALLLAKNIHFGANWYPDRLAKRVELGSWKLLIFRKKMVSLGMIKIVDKKFSAGKYSQQMRVDYANPVGVEFSYRIQKLWRYTPKNKKTNEYVEDKTLDEFVKFIGSEEHLVASKSDSKPRLNALKNSSKPLLLCKFSRLEAVARQYFGKPAMYLEHVIRDIPHDILLSPRDNNLYEPILWDFINAFNSVNRTEYRKGGQWKKKHIITVSTSTSPAFNKLKRKFGSQLRFRYQFPVSMQGKKKSVLENKHSAWFATNPGHPKLAPNMIEPVSYQAAYFVTCEGNLDYRRGFSVYHRQARQTPYIEAYGKRISEYMLTRDFRKSGARFKKLLADRLLNLDAAYRFSNPDVSPIFRQPDDIWKILGRSEKPKEYDNLKTLEKKRHRHSHWGLVWLRTSDDYRDQVGDYLIKQLSLKDVRGKLNSYLPLWTAVTPNSYEQQREKVEYFEGAHVMDLGIEIHVDNSVKSHDALYHHRERCKFFKKNNLYFTYNFDSIKQLFPLKSDKIGLKTALQLSVSKTRFRQGTYGDDYRIVKNVTTRQSIMEWMTNISVPWFNRKRMSDLWGQYRDTENSRESYFDEINDYKKDIRKNNPEIKSNRRFIEADKLAYQERLLDERESA